MTTKSKPRVGIGFLLLWAIADTGGWIGGIFAGFVLTIILGGFVIPSTPEFYWLGVLSIGAVLGATIGALQLLALYRHWYRFARDGAGVFQIMWVATSAVSGAIGLVIILVVLWNAINRNQIIAGGIAGLIVGIAQWLVLRRYVRHAGWWIIANGIGWAVTGGGLVTGLGAGVVTGVMLLWLLHHTPQEAEQLREKATPST